MKTIFKNFFFILRRFKTSSILNILGLSAAFAIFIVTIIQVRYDFGYDRNFEHADDIYMYNVHLVNDGADSYWMSTPLAKELADENSEIRAYCLITENSGLYDVEDASGNKTTLKTQRTSVGLGFMDVFAPKVLAGNPHEALKEKGKAILSASTAKQFFGDENPLGKRFFHHDSGDILTVVAVIADFPLNCMLKNGIYIHLPDTERSNSSCNGYYLVNPGDTPKLEQRINDPTTWSEGTRKYFEENPHIKILLIPNTQV